MLKVKGLAEMPESSTASSSGLHVTKTENVSFEKAEILASTDSTWGLDIRRSPSPMSPSIRRKRLRKSSTGSGSGSTERTSDELPSEITILPMQSSIKSEVVPTTQGRESVRSDSSLRTSIQEPSTDSEPREGSQESIDEDPLSLQASQDNSTGSMEHMMKESSPGPSTSQQATNPQAFVPPFRQTGSQRVLASVARRKTAVFKLRKGTVENFMQAIMDVRQGKLSFHAAGDKYGVSHMSLYRYYLSMGYPVIKKHQPPLTCSNIYQYDGCLRKKC